MTRCPTELTLDALLADPLTRLVMDSDGVSPEDTARAFLAASRPGRHRPRAHIGSMPIRRVADFPRPPVIEPVPTTIRVVLGGETVAQATAGRSWRVLETTHPPTYYLPPDAFRPGMLAPSHRTSFCEWKGVARYLTVTAGGRTEPDAAWSYPDPTPAYAALRDHVALYAGRMDFCFVGEERVLPQPGGFYGGWITSEFEGPFKGTPGTEFW